MFRSQPMSFYNLILPRESSYNLINNLGCISCIHFIDLQKDVPIYSRPYHNLIKRCQELLYKVDFIKEKMKFFGREVDELNEDKMNNFIKYAQKRYVENGFNEIQQIVDQKHRHLEEQIMNYQQIMENRNNLQEFLYILNKVGENCRQPQKDSDLSRQLVGYELTSICGTIDTAQIGHFQKVVFRVSKGNIITQFHEIDDPKAFNYNKSKKSIFMLMFSGGSYQMLEHKLMKIIEAYSAKKYDLPKDMSELPTRKEEIKFQISEQNQLLKLTLENLHQYFDYMCRYECSDSICTIIEEYRLLILKEMQIYSVINMMKMEKAIYYIQCWIPQDKEEEVIRVLQKVNKDSVGGQIRESKVDSMPPTYFKLNEFTSMFQLIVDTYGVPRYREINPGLFTITTFPFLFAVMFGDIFHGFLLFLFGIYLVLFANRLPEMLKVIRPTRYLILLMGLFAFYNGFIYNDFSSIQLNLFGTCYTINSDQTIDKEQNCTYIFGLDPIWSISENEVAYQNSMKMKVAVILGVAQMSLGIIMKGLNSLFFGKYLDFLFEFIPQIVFMVGLFGYMNFMIIYKWLTEFSDVSRAPGLIQTLINIPLSIMLGQEKGDSLWGEQQWIFENHLFYVAMICIPLMLIPKPFFEIRKMRQQQTDKYIRLETEAVHSQNSNNHQEEDESGELIVHQAIETIEFVLGSISNTASYLRLWALSLAHSQLAKVFFEKALKPGLLDGGDAITLMIGFQIFFGLTMAVLMIMDVMECFLHAIRLHWVEFQNKFYKADGYVFVPFSLQKALLNQNSE